MYNTQDRFQTSSAISGRALICAFLCGFGTAPFDTPAEAQMVGPNSGGQMATLRLVAASGLSAGKYQAGVDIALPPGAHTYWKVPGEAGVPPVFTFDGSDNVKGADVLYPAPMRLAEEGLDAFGYTGQVVFPVLVTPLDAAKPAILHATVNYAVCSRICVPAHGTATIRIEPHGAGQSASLVEDALGKVPRPVAAEAALDVKPAKGGGDPTWNLIWTGRTPLVDIFADAPDGFYFSTKKTGAETWTVTAAQSVTAPKATTVPVTLVLAGKNGAVQVTRVFDVGRPEH